MIAPLEYNPDKMGYDFLEKVQGQEVFHPGVDLNGGDSPRADLGMPVVAPASGRVIFASNNGKGWGKLMVIKHEQLSLYSRIAHFKEMHVVVGDEVKLGQQIGLCGESGTTSPHCHWELLNSNLMAWTMYPHGWTREEVQQVWLDPLATMTKLNESARIPDEFMPAVLWAIEQKIAVDWSNPSEIIGNGVQEAIFLNAGYLKEKLGHLSKLRSIVALYRALHDERVA